MTKPDFCVQDGHKLLLIGDSITDCERRGAEAPYGNGYVSMLRALVIGRWPERRITWVNKGIGGNTVRDLKARWEDDVVAEAPDWLSVKIGINDLHAYLADDRDGISPEEFRTTYRELLSRAKASCNPRMILITPFYISLDRSGRTQQSLVLELLPRYLEVVEEMAQQFDARLVRLQPMFERHLGCRPSEEFCPEPVHPNRTGHLLIAQEVLRMMKEA